ncbi:MAG: type II toxin-antitoxin system prevent-host-death family antitoxin [Caulobacteraceae bacterium]|nr:type II toxin-antitoxin system prevent-host-death family antitoxin [Caulobacter sp.]
MREVGVLQAKTQLSSLIEGIEAGGEEVVITRRGKPVARLVAAPSKTAPKRRYSGAELLAMSEALREQIARENPETGRMTWEELKALARS